MNPTTFFAGLFTWPLRMEVLIFRVLSSVSCSDLPVRIDHGVPRIASSILCLVSFRRWQPSDCLGKECTQPRADHMHVRLAFSTKPDSESPRGCKRPVGSSGISRHHSLTERYHLSSTVALPMSEERCLEKAAASDCPDKDGMIRGTSPRRTLLCPVREEFGHHPQLICGLSQLLQVLATVLRMIRSSLFVFCRVCRRYLFLPSFLEESA